MSNGFTTAVPQPFFGPNGIVVPTENAILTGVQTDLNTALGGNINPQLSTPQGQIASTETAIIGDSNAQFAFFCNQVDPALNQGRMQDAIGRIYFMTRIWADRVNRDRDHRRQQRTVCVLLQSGRSGAQSGPDAGCYRPYLLYDAHSGPANDSAVYLYRSQHDVDHGRRSGARP